MDPRLIRKQIQVVGTGKVSQPGGLIPHLGSFETKNTERDFPRVEACAELFQFDFITGPQFRIDIGEVDENAFDEDGGDSLRTREPVCLGGGPQLLEFLAGE